MHAADLADVAEALPIEQLKILLRVLPADRAADVLEYLDEELRSEVLEEMSAAQAAKLVSEMTPDDRVDALEELEEAFTKEILAEIPAEARRETEKLLTYAPDSAGGIMTTEFVQVPETITVEEALANVRRIARAGRREAMHAIYVTDAQGVLRGVHVTPRAAGRARGRARRGRRVGRSRQRPCNDGSRRSVARKTSEYDLVAVPVVDDAGRVIGVVTVDDVIDAIVEEQTEDVQKLGAVQPLEEPYFQAGFWSIARKRGGWLTLLFIEEMFTGTALRHYEATLASADRADVLHPADHQLRRQFRIAVGDAHHACAGRG